MKNIHNSEEILNKIVKAQFYSAGCGGDILLMTALTRFICVCSQFDKANYNLVKAIKLSKTFAKCETQQSQEVELLYFLQDACIGYIACYDTLLQVLYFGLRLCDEMQTQNDFQNEIKNLKWMNSKDSLGVKEYIFQTQQINYPEVVDFMHKATSFFETSRQRIAKFANAMKHGGGLILESMKSYIPPCSKANQEITILYRPNRRVEFVVPNEGLTFFKYDWLYPETVEPSRLINILKTQNKNIYEFAIYLYNFLQYDKLYDLNPLKDKYVYPYQ